MPLFAGAFLVILFGAIGVPFTNGFIGEFLILNSLYSYDVLSAILAGSGVILGAVYMLNLYKRVILGTDNKTNYLDINDVDKFLYLSLVFVIIITGVYSSCITKLMLQFKLSFTQITFNNERDHPACHNWSN